VENQQMQQLFNHVINYVYYLLHDSALHFHLQGEFLVPSDIYSIEEQSIVVDGRVVFSDVVRGDLIFQKALETLHEDGNVMPKHVGAAIHN
jgi:hypothetical protein